MGSPTQDITSRQVIDPWIKGSQRELLRDATKLANLGYQPYEGPRVAGPTEAQKYAYGLLGEATGMQQPDEGPAPWEYQAPDIDSTEWPSNYPPTTGFQHGWFEGQPATGGPGDGGGGPGDDSPPWGGPGGGGNGGYPGDPGEGQPHDDYYGYTGAPAWLQELKGLFDFDINAYGGTGGGGYGGPG